MRSKGVYYAILITMMLTLSGCDQLMAEYANDAQTRRVDCIDGAKSKGDCANAPGKQFDDLNPFIKSIRERH